MDSPFPLLLIVDDDPVMTKVLAMAGKLQGWEVWRSHVPKEAMSMALTGRFQGIFVDYQMAGMTGLELVTNLRTQGCSIPVAMITGYASNLDRDELTALGVIDLVAEPVGFDRITTILERFKTFLMQPASSEN